MVISKSTREQRHQSPRDDLGKPQGQDAASSAYSVHGWIRIHPVCKSSGLFFNSRHVQQTGIEHQQAPSCISP